MKEGPFSGKKVYMAPQDEIGKYDARLQDLLRDCFGIKGALITDMSSLSDFSVTADDMKKLRLLYDARAQESDTLLEVARRVWGE